MGRSILGEAGGVGRTWGRKPLRSDAGVNGWVQGGVLPVHVKALGLMLRALSSTREATASEEHKTR